MRLLLFFMVLNSLVANAADDGSVQVTCKKGFCFLRKKQSAWNLPIAEGQQVSAKLGDVVLSLGVGSQLEVEYADGTIAGLKNSGLLRIKQGSKDLLLTQGEESSEGAFRKDGAGKEKSNLFYVGNVPLKFLTPPMGDAIVMQKFPKKLLVTFKVDSGAADAAAESKLGRWRLLKLENQSWRDLGAPVNFLVQANDAEKIWSAEVVVESSGEYLLKPMTNVSLDREGGFLLNIKGTDALESEINNLIERAKTNPNANIEIRN